MKVGILTFHRAHNYGAVLQCYALQTYLQKHGHIVEIVDYRQPWIESFYKSFSISYIRRRVHGVFHFLSYIKNFPNRKKIIDRRRENFVNFSKTFLNLSNRLVNKDDFCNYDVVIIGSDQLWSLNCLGEQFDDFYLGKIKMHNAPRIIGYAISSNRYSIERLCSLDPKVFLNFDKLSVREKYMQTQIDKVCPSVKAQLTLDPTLLLDSQDWNPITDKAESVKESIVVYQVRAPQGRTQLKTIAANLAQKYNLEVIDLSDSLYDIPTFLSAIKKAKCVITSSFHATVFSIVYGRPIYCYKLNDGKDDRYIDLLNLLDMEEHIVELGFSPDSIREYDSEKVLRKLSEIRKDSESFLNL